MKRKAAEYSVLITLQNGQVVRSHHRALDAKDARRLALRDYPGAARVEVFIHLPLGPVVVEDWRNA